jgi:predicted metal-dependent hydrolase
MEFDWNRGALSDGLRCYRREEFFAAHEHWEILWRKSHGPEKSFLQALIQVAGGFHHLQRNNLQGATALLGAARRRLEAYPARFGGLDVAGLHRELGRWLEALAAKDVEPAPPYPQLCIAPAADVAAADAASNGAGKDG